MASDGSETRGADMGKAQLSSLAWIEPVMIVATMVASVIVNRRKSYSIFPSSTTSSRRNSADGLVDKDEYLSDSDDSLQSFRVRSRDLEGTTPHARPFYAIAVFNRILQKFPFLVEMFYWALNYVAYRLSKMAAASLHGHVKGDAVRDIAREHGESLLHLEHETPLALFFFVKEISVQQFFLINHLGLMSIMNQIYSLVHIPGTVAFISWYYYAAPNHNTFAIARRTMTLGDFVAFAVFAVYPCMPPRLLPESYGFADTVRQANAQSVWVADTNNINQFAAMPSLHFTFALIIGCTFWWHSGFLQQFFRGKPRDRSFLGMVGFMVAGVLYPMLVLLVIVATANHYYLDAVAAGFSIMLCFFCNKIWLLLLPLERLILRILRLEKPIPTTGEGRKNIYTLEESNYTDLSV
ncbi:hypothetical protein LTR37_014269 [Vermiconidia calcicola]|uniref:Uncharacterized protein n=1 Tax=Vermiconidia calcicola TaxID=1690605 RepID=A0ACC3MTY4_9PEZI|nr:hypothetical protein LTR37_014269 [Vermiconidia calcicola]